MSSYPSNAGRGSRGAGARAAAIPWGSQPAGWGPPVRPAPWYGGLGRFAGVGLRFAGAVGIAITAVELYRWYKGQSGPNPALTVECSTGSVDRGWIETTFDCGVSYYVTPGEEFGGPYPETFNPGAEWAGLGYDGLNFAGLEIQRIRQKVVNNTGVAQPGEVNTPPIWSPFPAWAYSHPMAQPIAQPVWVPPYVPVATGPAVPALPEDSVGGQPGAVAPPLPVAPVNPGLSITPGGTAPITLPGVRAVPAPNTLEQKLRMRPGVRLAVSLFNQATEFADAIDALFDALPARCKNHAKFNAAVVGKPNTAEKAAAVTSCFGGINWNDAMFNFLSNSIEDAIWAKLGLPTKEAGLSYGTNAPINTALGQVLGDAIAGGTKAFNEALRNGWDTAGDAIKTASRRLARDMIGA